LPRLRQDAAKHWQIRDRLAIMRDRFGSDIACCRR
jgi:hypothetical protein